MQNLNPQPYQITKPTRFGVPIVLSAPHAGRYLPPAFLQESLLNETALLSTADLGTDAIARHASSKEIHLISNTYARSFVDLNRSIDELDPALICDISGDYDDLISARLRAGFGVIPRCVSRGQVIRAGKLAKEAVNARLELAYHPFHDALRALLAQALGQFGRCFLVDIHSMPRGAGGHANIVLGDGFGASIRTEVTDFIGEKFIKAGYRVARNAPFSGGFITRNYGRANGNVQALQIEIDRGLILRAGEPDPRACAEIGDVIGTAIRGVIPLILAGK